MVKAESGVDPYLFGDLRHLASWAYVNGITNRTFGLLSTQERQLGREQGMILPRPVRPHELSREYELRVYDMDRWMCRIGCNVDGDPAFGVWQREGTWDVARRPAYVVSGVCDVLHGGHWDYVNKAVGLAEATGGYVYVLIENNDYVKRFKKKLPVYDELTRSAWFRGFGNIIDRVVIWHGSKSWVEAYHWLGELMGSINKNQVFFVLPKIAAHLPHTEGYALWNRERQITKAGFSVVEVEATYGGVSSSKLRQRFGLKSTPEVLEREQAYGVLKLGRVLDSDPAVKR